MARKPWEKENWHVTSWLTAVCFGFFLLAYQNPDAMMRTFGFERDGALGRLELWRFLSYPFFFGGPVRFLFTVFVLMIMGSALEAVWGSAQFLLFVLVSVLGASGMAALLGVPLQGMGGLDFNLLVAYAIHFPDAVFLIWFVLPVKAKWLAWIAALALLTVGLMGGLPGLAMMLGTSSGLVYWALRLRTQRAARVVRQRVRAVSAAIVPRRDTRAEAKKARETIAALQGRLTGPAPTERDRATLAELREQITPSVNVCPEGYFEPEAESCVTCNGFLECALAAFGLSDLPSRKAGGMTATGMADALSAFHAREREEKRRARMAAARPALL